MKQIAKGYDLTRRANPDIAARFSCSPVTSPLLASKERTMMYLTMMRKSSIYLHIPRFEKIIDSKANG